MRRAFVLAALSSLLLSSRVDAGVASLNAVSSCPSIIKNVITVEMLLSDEFVPWDVPVGTVVIIDTVDIVDNVDTINTVNIIDTIDIVDTINTAITIDTMINTINTINTIDATGQEPSEKKRKIKFGRRVAFNHSQVSNVRVRIYTYDGDAFSFVEYRNKAVFGLGFEVAGIIDWVISDALFLNLSPGVIFRKPINTSVVGTSEVGVSMPILLEWGPFGAVKPEPSAALSPPPLDAFAKSGRFDPRQLRLFGGVWFGAPVYARVKWNGEASAPFKERAVADFGLVCGVGVYVSDKAFVDARGIFGLSGYDGAEGRRLNQLAIGVNYVK